MAALDADTIAAIATPPGLGGIAVVRISGPDARRIAVRVAGAEVAARIATVRAFRDADGETLDQGLVLRFVAPHSFTGEDVVELHGHGGPVIAARLLDAVLAAGARLARPGEFSERAFLNGKLDLTQAEAIADLIGAASVAAARGAMRSLSGEFSRRIAPLSADTLALRVFVEAAIDFPDEEVELLADGQVGERAGRLAAGLDALLADSAEGVLLGQGIRVAIVGAPNVGKSSLLNALAGADEAIVTELPGTTRDLLKVDLVLGGLPVTLVDTAGLRDTGDPIEAEGIRRARAEAGRADLVLEVVDDTATIPASSERSADAAACLRVVNKIDLSGRAPGEVSGAARAVAVSAATGAGLEDLVAAVHAAVGYRGGEGTFTARTRHVQALRRARAALLEVVSLSENASAEVVAEELRAAHAALGEITGEVTPDDLLGEIFASFCIGK